jgi:hypothetical protein
VKTGNPSAYVIVNCKLCKSAFVLYSLLSTTCVNKVLINPIQNPLLLVTDLRTRDNIETFALLKC